MKKILNIGSGWDVIKGAINIDDGSDMPIEELQEMVRNEYEYKDDEYVLAKMDGNDMPLQPDYFDIVFSSQCVGIYVTNYEEIVRVLKPDGKIILIVWGHVIQSVVVGLLRQGIHITSISPMNGDIEDDAELEYITVTIVGVKRDVGIDPYEEMGI